MEDVSGMLRHHLTCPISLQPMQDPVTAPTGITYDRRAIKRWLAAGHATCPVTGQPLALADLTPNHTLRRLIQSWHPRSTTSSTPVPVPSEAVAAAADEVVKKLMMCTSTTAAAASSPPPPVVDVLREAAEVASESDAARRRMVDAGVLHRVLRLLTVKCAAADQEMTMLSSSVEAGLDLVRALAVSSSDDELLLLVADRHVHDVLDAVTDVLVTLERTTTAAGCRNTARASAVSLLDSVLEAAASAGGGSTSTAAVLERLRPALFPAVTAVVRDRVSPAATRSALRVLLHACPLPRHRALLADAGAAHEAIELLLDAPPSSSSSSPTTELCMALLVEVSGCAEGRAAVAAHAAGVAVVARRIRLRRRGVSSSAACAADADACGVRVLAAVAGRAASPELLREMARVGAVGKLCCVLQADCDADVRDAARAVLRMHAGVWSRSPCVSAYLLSRYL